MKIELFGAAQSKLAYFIVDKNWTSYSSDTNKQYNPPISPTETAFGVFFNNKLLSVNPETGAAPERITVYRVAEGADTQFQIATIKLGEADMPNGIIDLSAANDVTYQYILYPEDENVVYAGTIGTRSINGEATIDGFVACEELIIANWNDDYGAYVAEKIFYFDANNQASPMQNNAVVQKNQTFGRFFHIQHGATNVLSGQVSSMIGYVDCETMEFVSTFEMEDTIRWLTTDYTTKFYKNARGYVLPVDITSAITFQPDRSWKLTSVQFEWTERSLPHPPSVIGVLTGEV